LRKESKQRRLEAKALKTELEQERTKAPATPAGNQDFEALYKQTQAQLQEAQSAMSKLSLDQTRLRVGIELGLKPDLAARLVGNDEEELRADAQRLAELLKPSAPETPPPPPSAPTPPASLTPFNPTGGGPSGIAELVRQKFGASKATFGGGGVIIPEQN
jgi:hypothetical protein